MNKILSIKKASQIANQLNKDGTKIVLVGGCFDILHVGHITFLENAKKQADSLFILLESDKSISKIKGKNRPINSQSDRAKILETLEMVDYIIPLEDAQNDKYYDNLVSSLKPAIIATTKGDSGKVHKERQARLIGAKVVEVVEPVINKSTTKLVEILKEI